MSVDDAVSVTRRSVIRLTGAALTLPAAAPLSASLLENRRMTFTPNFVDLVRNYTTTTGTADFKLGSVVNGYTSFTSALQVGDTFYYAALGVDRPTEREVGRGTLLANGIVQREPISGPKTNFTSGTKTLSLVAAAEWFNTMQAGGGAAAVAAPAVAATRAALAGIASREFPALLIEDGREGLFLFDAANRSAEVAADPQQAIYVAAASDPTGAGGAWARKYDGAKSARWFGAKGDGTTDDTAALQAWLDSGGELSLPTGEYYSSATLILRNHAVIRGGGYGFDFRSYDGSATRGYDNMPGSRIRFAAGVGGLNVQPQTTVTDPAGDLTTIQEPAIYSAISELALIGAATGAAATGLYSRTVVHLHNVQVLRFTGKGFDISATTVAGDASAEYGNASLATLTNCHAIENGSHGFHVRGADANVIKFDTCNASSNGGWGFLDEGLLGNEYVGCHAALNTSGSFKATSNVGRNIYLGCYAEEAGVTHHCSLPSTCTIIGGLLANLAAAGANDFPGDKALIINNSRVYNSTISGLATVDNASDGSADLLKLKSGAGAGAEKSVIWADDANTWARMAAGYDGPSAKAYMTFGHLYNGGYTTSEILRLTPTGATLNGTLSVPALAGGTSSAGTLRSTSETAFGSGAGLEMEYNNGAGAGVIRSFDRTGAAFLPLSVQAGGISLEANYSTITGYVGGNLKLTVSGTGLSIAGAGAFTGPVTSSGGGVGYATGAGGTVTQATSKSTGVTLNKLCGQVTLNAASLAAATIVSFSLTNSQIAAGDVLILNHVSGGTLGAYGFNAACGAGSASIQVRNNSAAALAEAIVLRFAVIKGVAA